MIKAEFNVQGMTCGGCERSVQNALTSHKGVTAAKADLYAPLRSGTDIPFLNGLVNFILENNLYQEEYVRHYTNAPFLVNADWRGRGVVRRLNRVEFETALGDLLDTPLRLRDLLPPDAMGAGFDTVGAALNVSAVQMEAYLQAIDFALDEATKLIERPATKTWRLSYLQTHGMMEEYRRSGPHTPEPDGIAMFAPDFFSHMNSLLDTWVVPHSARYRVKVAARALRSAEPVTLTVRMGGPGNKEDDDVPRKVLGNVSVVEAPAGRGQVFEFEAHLERGQMFRIYPSSLRKMRFEGPEFQMKQKDYTGPAVVVQWIEVEGPIYESWPPPSHERLWAGVKVEAIPGVEQN